MPPKKEKPTLTHEEELTEARKVASREMEKNSDWVKISGNIFGMWKGIAKSNKEDMEKLKGELRQEIIRLGIWFSDRINMVSNYVFT